MSVLEEVVGTGQGRLGLTVYRVVDVQAIAQQRGTLGILLAVAVVLVFQPCQRLMLPAAELEVSM